ncbi:hypothetical protein LZ32DRAFT_462235 [Colletotrichum eremochloae]|nr:hypothetical protein LZ32DRAFT_462235 [Colletotrichum eremochloae]
MHFGNHAHEHPTITSHNSKFKGDDILSVLILGTLQLVRTYWHPSKDCSRFTILFVGEACDCRAHVLSPSIRNSTALKITACRLSLRAPRSLSRSYGSPRTPPKRKTPHTHTHIHTHVRTSSKQNAGPVVQGGEVACLGMRPGPGPGTGLGWRGGKQLGRRTARLRPGIHFSDRRRRQLHTRCRKNHGSFGFGGSECKGFDVLSPPSPVSTTRPG